MSAKPIHERERERESEMPLNAFHLMRPFAFTALNFLALTLKKIFQHKCELFHMGKERGSDDQVDDKDGINLHLSPVTLRYSAFAR